MVLGSKLLIARAALTLSLLPLPCKILLETSFFQDSDDPSNSEIDHTDLELTIFNTLAGPVNFGTIIHAPNFITASNDNDDCEKGSGVSTRYMLRSNYTAHNDVLVHQDSKASSIPSKISYGAIQS